MGQDELSEFDRRKMVKEAMQAQAELDEILEKITQVKQQLEKLDGENIFLQDYIGNLMATSKMLKGGSTSTSSSSSHHHRSSRIYHHNSSESTATGKLQH